MDCTTIGPLRLGDVLRIASERKISLAPTAIKLCRLCGIHGTEWDDWEGKMGGDDKAMFTVRHFCTCGGFAYKLGVRLAHSP